jgi:hypothetical protein
VSATATKVEVAEIFDYVIWFLVFRYQAI